MSATETHPAALPSDHAGLLETEALKTGLPLLQLAEVIRNKRYDGIKAEAAAQQLEAADELLQRQAEALAALGRVQPVAWRTRQKPTGATHWGDWHFGRMTTSTDGWDFEEQPLYATPPAPQPALALIEELERALIKVRSIIADGATTGFNWADGDWAERLYASQQTSSTALASTKRFKGE